MTKKAEPEAERPQTYRCTHKGNKLAALCVGAMSVVIVFMMLASVVTPKRHDVRAGEIAQQTITATKDIEDDIVTDALRQQARDKVERSFRQDDVTTQRVMDALSGDIDTFTAEREEFKRYKAQFTDSASVMPLPGALGRLREQMPWLLSSDVALSDVALRQWLIADDAAFGFITERTLNVVRAGMDEGIREDALEARLARMETELRAGVYAEANMLPVATVMIKHYVEPNVFYDEAKTLEEREAAAAAVEPVIVKKGQNVVVAGEIITEAEIHLLSRLGLLSTDEVDWELYIGIALIVLALAQVITVYVIMFEPVMRATPPQLMLLSTIIVITLGLAIPLRIINPYLIPVQCGTLLIALLLRPRLALMANIALSILTALMATGDEGMLSATVINIMLTNLACGTVTVLMARKALLRSTLVLSGFVTAAANFAIMFGVGFMTITDIRPILINAAFAAGGGMLSTLLAAGIMPMLEAAFNLVTPQKLLELSNPNHPLLRQLQLEASGTYHHSLLVANLAEAAADAVGGSALLCRVGAYYHDVGKVRRPGFFMENVMGENPHDQMDPRVSTAVIISHPRDGVQAALKHKLPRQIIDIIQQHHGTTPVLYFYNKALKNSQAADGAAENVDIQDFRYDGPRPRSKEAAIVMLADTVEAAARSVPEPTQEKVEALVRRLVREKLDDGQLNEAPLTLADIERVIEAFMIVFTGIYHQRIEYPRIRAGGGG